MVGFISSEDNPIFLPLSADWRFLLFTTMLGVLTCLLCGTAPALQAARSDPGYALKGSGRGSTAGGRGGAGRRGVGGLRGGALPGVVGGGGAVGGAVAQF